MPIQAIALIIGLVILIPAIATYPKWSWKAYEARCVKNSTHPDWTPYCGKNFLDKDGNLIP